MFQMQLTGAEGPASAEVPARDEVPARPYT